ncbi:MAG: hypothetical protein ACOY16_11765 [Chloroflexota bacterium]
MKTSHKIGVLILSVAVAVSFSFPAGFVLAQEQLPACPEGAQGIVVSIDPANNSAILQLDDGSQCSTSLDQVKVHPVAALLSLYYQVPLQEINTYHQQGLGFGVLVKLYALASATSESESPVSVADLVAQFQSGTGIGQLFHTYGKPVTTGVGQVRKQQKNNPNVTNHTPPGQTNKNKIKNKVKTNHSQNNQSHGKSPKFAQPTPMP